VSQSFKTQSSFTFFLDAMIECCYSFYLDFKTLATVDMS